MDRKGLSILSGLAEGFERASSNLVNLSYAKQKLLRDKEISDLQRKKLDADIKLVDLKGQELEFEKTTKEKELATATHFITTIQEYMEQAQREERPLELPLDYSVDLGLLEIKSKSKIPRTQLRKEELQKNEALAILKRGWGSDDEGDFEFQDREEATDYIIDKYDIDITDSEIQNALMQYKKREEEIIPAREGFFGIVKRKYPTKEKYGFTYERREDGKWHRIEK